MYAVYSVVMRKSMKRRNSAGVSCTSTVEEIFFNWKISCYATACAIVNLCACKCAKASMCTITKQFSIQNVL